MQMGETHLAESRSAEFIENSQGNTLQTKAILV